MPPIPPPQAWEDDYRFHRLLVDCLEKLEEGDEVDLDAMTARWPQFRKPVESFLADRQVLMQSLQAPLAEPSDFVTKPTKGEPRFDRSTRFELFAANPRSDRIASSDGEPSLKSIGQYVVEEEVARGGMGVVYKARQAGVERTVALKMILTGRLANAADVDRFKREVCAAGNLIHPNIVRIHEAGRITEQPFFTMDFIDGPSLAEKLADGSIPAREAAALTETLARAIDYAHQRGVVHRDLKPANILLDGTGTPHVTDFGLAKLLTSFSTDAEELTNTGQILGTPGYMSPEQAVGKPHLITESTDVYSLGAILYACLTGRAPFVADTTLETLTQVLNNDPVSIRLLNPDVPIDLETICFRALAKDPSRRYPTAIALAEDLHRFLKGHPIEARRARAITHVVKWCRRRPDAAALVASLATVAVVAFLAIGSATIKARRATHESRLHLYKSYMGQAATTRVARQSGYRQEAWRLLQLASAIPEITIDQQRIRQEAVLCMGDFVGDRAINIDVPASLRSNDCALFLDDSRILIGQNRGDVLIRDLEKQSEDLIARYGSPVATACVLDSPQDSVVLGDQNHLERWDRHPRDGWMRRWQTPARFPSHFVPLAHSGNLIFFADGVRVRAVSAKTGRTEFHLNLPVDFALDIRSQPFQAVAVSHDGRFVAAAESGEQVFVWETTGKKRIHRLKTATSGTPFLRFDSADEFLIIGANEGVVIYGCDRFELCSDFPTDAVKSMSTSSTDPHLLVLTKSGSVELWDLHSKKRTAALKHPGEVQNGACVAFSPSGHRFLSSHKDQIRIWDLHGSGEKLSLAAHHQPVQRIAYSVSETTLASGGRDGTVRFWNAISGNPIALPTQVDGPVESLAFSNCGRWFAAATRKSIHLWNTSTLTRKISRRFPDRTLSDLCFNDEGTLLFVTGLGLLPTDPGHTDVWKIQSHGAKELPSLTRSASCGSGGQSILCDGKGTTVCMQTDRRLAWSALADSDLDWSSSISADFRSLICRPSGASEIFVISQSGGIESQSGGIEQIDLVTQKRTVVAAQVKCPATASLAVTPSKRCAAVTEDPSTVVLYDLQTGQIIFRLAPMQAVVTSLRWGREGRQLAIGLADGRLVLWNLDWVADELRSASLWGDQALWYDPLKPSQRPLVAPRQQQWEAVDQAIVRKKRMQQLLKQWAVPETIGRVDSSSDASLADTILTRIHRAEGAVSQTEAIVLRLPLDELSLLSSSLRSSGYHIQELRPYSSDGRMHLAAIWKRHEQPTEFRIGLTRPELERTIDSMRRSGYAIAQFGGYIANPSELSPRHFAIFEPANVGQPGSRRIRIEATNEVNPVAANDHWSSEQILNSHLCFDATNQPYRCIVFQDNNPTEVQRRVETLSEKQFRQQANRFAQRHVFHLNATRDRANGELEFHVVTGETGPTSVRPLLCHEPIEFSREVAQRMMSVGYRPAQLAVTDDGHATILFDLPGSESTSDDDAAPAWTDI